MPPGSPSYTSPANLAPGVSTSATLTWDGGPWAHLYDIHLGTTPDPPLLAKDQELGSPDAGKLDQHRHQREHSRPAHVPARELFMDASGK